MTKKDCIAKSMIYTGDSNVLLCIDHIKKVLKDVSLGNISLENSKIIEPSAGNGSFYGHMKNLDIIAYDIEPSENFTQCVKTDFLEVKEIDTDKDYKIFIGFPPTRNYENFIQHSFELDADVIGYILPISAVNKKNTKIYNDNGYTIVFNKQILNDDFKLAMGSDWDMTAHFIVIMKNENIEKDVETIIPNHKSYKDYFDVYTINDTILKIKETSQPNLFREGRSAKNRKTGKPYEILTDENGSKYYLQKGINLDKIDECQLFLPLRVFPSNEEGLILYDTFYNDTFAKIGYGLKVKDGYSVRKAKGKIIYYLYKEIYKGIYTLVAKMDDDVVKNFYAVQRYNNGVYISSKKLIEANKKGIL